MKFLLALCFVLYFLAEVSAKPTPQMFDQARDLLEKVKVKIQEAMDQAQETGSRAFETAKNALQNGINSAQQTAQNKFGIGENLTQLPTVDVSSITATTTT